MIGRYKMEASKGFELLPRHDYLKLSGSHSGGKIEQTYFH
jgi:hypothetical protein